VKPRTGPAGENDSLHVDGGASLPCEAIRTEI